MTLGLRDGVGALIAPIVMALALTGCGGASGAATTSDAGAGTGSTAGSRSVGEAGVASSSSPTLSSAQLIARADAICTRSNEGIAAIAPKSGSRQEIKRVVPRHVALERAAIGELERLVPPASLAEGWNSMLGYRRTLAAELDRLLLAAERGDKSSARGLTVSKRHVHTELKAVADKVGFRACGTVG